MFAHKYDLLHAKFHHITFLHGETVTERVFSYTLGGYLAFSRCLLNMPKTTISVTRVTIFQHLFLSST